MQLARRLCETCAPPGTLLRVARSWFEDPKSPPGIRAVAGYVMGACGHDEPKVTTELVGTLTASDACVRVMCAEGLGRQASPYSPFGSGDLKPSHPAPAEATRALVSLLDDPEKDVRMAALQSLWWIAWQARGVGPELLEFARKKRPARREEAEVAERAMARIGVPELADHLLQIIANAQNPQERRKALKHLADLGFNLKSSDPATHEQVAGHIGPALCEMCSKERIPEGVPLCIGMFSPHVADAVPTLEKLLDRLSTAEKAERREISSSIWALGEIGPPAASAVPKLLKLAADPDMKPELSRFADAFIGIGVSNAEVTACLLMLIETLDRSYYRDDAVRALGTVGVPTEEALARLRALLEDPDAQIARQAKEALDKLEAKSVVIKDAGRF